MFQLAYQAAFLMPEGYIFDFVTVSAQDSTNTLRMEKVFHARVARLFLGRMAGCRSNTMQSQAHAQGRR